MTDGKGELRITHGARRAFAYLLALMLLISAAGVVIGVREFAALQREIHAGCQFDADLGKAPIVVPGGGKPSVLGVSIVSDSRVAWHHAGCSGQIPAPDPSFVHWARYYHLPYR